MTHPDSNQPHSPPTSADHTGKPEPGHQGHGGSHHHPEHGHQLGGHKGHHEHGPHVYKIQIDKAFYELHDPTPTGRELLEKAGKTPPERYAIYEKVKGGPPRRVELNQHVDLRHPGVERFVTLPLDQTEGLGERRQFMLPEEDRDWLEIYGHRYELVNEDGVLRVVLYGLVTPPGYNHPQVDLNVRIESGYPDTQIDMVYFHPPLARADGKPIKAISTDSFDGKTWQRWSRHRTHANAWRPGVDCLMTHIAQVRHWLESELTKA